MMLKALPNLLTLARIAVIPVIIALLYCPEGAARWGAFALFLAAGITDFFDGWLARRLGAASRLGALLDPMADKLIVAAILVVLVAQGGIGGIHVVAAILILLRELSISGLREFLAGDRVRLPVSALAKWKTTSQLAALTLLLVPVPAGTLHALALALLWLAAVLSVWTGAQYAVGTYRHWGGAQRKAP